VWHCHTHQRFLPDLKTVGLPRESVVRLWTQVPARHTGDERSPVVDAGSSGADAGDRRRLSADTSTHCFEVKWAAKIDKAGDAPTLWSKYPGVLINLGCISTGGRSRAARRVEVGWTPESAASTAPLHVQEWS
jgi:hypothetical protein